VSLTARIAVPVPGAADIVGFIDELHEQPELHDAVELVDSPEPGVNGDCVQSGGHCCRLLESTGKRSRPKTLCLTLMAPL